MLRVITVVTFAAGLAGFVTTVLTRLPGAGERAAWLAPILAIPLRLAYTFLPAAIASFVLMPSTTALARRSEPGEDADLPLLLVLFLVGLCAIAAFDASPLVTWWAENLEQVRTLYAGGSDPMGLNMIPSVALVSMPLLATAIVLTFVLTSVMAVVSRTEWTFRVVGSCVALQAGLVAGAYLLMDGLRDVGTMVSEWLTSEATRGDGAAAAEQAATWFTRQDALGSAVISRLLWIFGGYVVALVAVEFMGRRAAPATPPAPTATARATALNVPLSSGVASASAAASAFDRSTYGVRPAMSVASVFRHRSNEYRIESIPRSAAASFSFSWSSGLVRREADGASVLALRVHEHRWFQHATYAVFDGAIDAPLGLLRPDGHDWDVLSGAGQKLAHIGRNSVAPGYVRYVAAVAGVEVCRFTWTAGALAMSSGELEIDFVPGTEHLFDRAFAIAAGPILEEQARRLMWRRNR